MKYHLARGEQQLGTFSDLEVSSGLRDGRFKPADLCWTDGMAGWETLQTRMKGLAADIGEEIVIDPPQAAALREEVRKDQDEQPVLADLWQRLAAILVDLFLFMTPVVVMFSLVMDDSFKTQLKPIQDDPQAVAELLQRRVMEMTAVGNPTLELMSILMIVVALTTLVLLTLRGQSIGKLLLGIEIVRFADGGKAGFVKVVLLRGVLFAVIGNLRYVGLGFLLMDVLLILRQDRRCLHDLVADTKVVRRRRPARR